MKPKSSSSRHHLARAVQAVLLDDVLPDREAEVVGVDGERGLLPDGERPHHVGMRLDRREVSLLRQEVGFAQQARVPVGGPALVHDLAGEHRVEVERLRAHREEDVALPVLELGGVVGDEPEQVVFRMRRHARAQRPDRRHLRVGFPGQAAKPLAEVGFRHRFVFRRRTRRSARGAARRSRRRAVRARARRRAPPRRSPARRLRSPASMRCACAAACSTMLPPAISWKRENSWLFLEKSAWPSTCAVTSVFSASELPSTR